MISLHNIFSIAKYERKTLLRSWFFRIFSVLSLLVLFGMNFGMIIQGGGEAGWAIRSIPAAIPYFNLLILNVAQAIIAVFLASDFLKRDKKLDTTEVIYMRSMTNGEYVIGKTWGNLQVFLVLNIAVIFMALIFNMLAQDTTIHWASYGIYLLIISVPTLVFIMGLSFLLMSVIRNQAITFVLILGYIGITLFLIEDKYYYLFDYMAFNIPMLISDIAGMGSPEKVFIHRAIYLSLGLGFIFLTIFLLKRLPQSDSMTFFSLIFAVVLFAAGGYLAYTHIFRFKSTETLRAKAIEINNQYVKEKLPTTLAHDLSVEHKGETIEATARITLENETEKALDKLIFNLNDGLEIKNFQINGQETPFVREYQLILAREGVHLDPGEQAVVTISYSGKINETLCYLDISEEDRLKKYGKFVLNVVKRYAFLSEDYVLLTPEANWYPKTGVTYSTVDVSWYHPEFIDFRLDVKTQPELTAISQGEPRDTSDGVFSFHSPVPLTQISLAIGNYKVKKTEQDSIQLGIWHLEGHDFFSDAFPETRDTIPQLVNERLGDFERTYNLDYAFDRFFLVEVPAQFKSYERTWMSRQEYVQPGQILIPEKGYLIREADLEGMKKRMQRWGRGRGGSEMTDKDIEIRLLMDFLGVFTREESRDFSRNRGEFSITEYPNPYFAFPMLYSFQNNIQSDKYPVINRIFEAYLKSQSVDMHRGWMRNMQGMSEDELANIALQDSTFEEIISDPEQKKIIDNVIKLKGEVLFSMVQWKAGQEEFEDYLSRLLKECRFKNIPFRQFDRQIYETFGVELIPVMEDWFKAKELPGYLFSPVEAVKVKTEQAMKSKISMKITNFTDTEGVVKISFRLGGRGRGPRPVSGDDMINKLVYLEPHQTKEVSYMLDADPRMVMINTLTSKNIPQLIMEGFREIEEDPRATPFEGEVVLEDPVIKEGRGETIVDNEDPGFEVDVTDDISLLEKWIIKDTGESRKYSGLNFWRPPSNWTAVTNSDFFGEYIRSAYYTKSGDGSLNARWHLPVKEAGYYDLYYHLHKPHMLRRRGGEESGEYLFTVHSDDGAEEVSLETRSAEEGWNHLGSFYFSPDTALIELSNKSQLKVLFADAVKIIKL